MFVKTWNYIVSILLEMKYGKLYHMQLCSVSEYFDFKQIEPTKLMKWLLNSVMLKLLNSATIYNVLIQYWYKNS